MQRTWPWQLDEDWKLSGEGRWTVEGLAKEVGAPGKPPRARAPVWSADRLIG